MLKRNKGITLIALLITVIVMLILAGVTVATALNEGVFTRSKTAASKTQAQADKEMLVAAVLAATDDYGNFSVSSLDSSLPEGFTGSNGTYTKNGVTYSVNSNGIVTDNSSSSGGTGGYQIGQEITLGEDTFNVIGQTSDQLILFASNNTYLGCGVLNSMYISSGTYSASYGSSYGSPTVIFSSYLSNIKDHVEEEWGHSISEIRCINVEEIASILDVTLSDYYAIGSYMNLDTTPEFLRSNSVGSNNDGFWIDNPFGSSGWPCWCSIGANKMDISYDYVGPRALRPVIVVNKADL